jgi:hypothetical protein
MLQVASCKLRIGDTIFPTCGNRVPTDENIATLDRVPTVPPMPHRYEVSCPTAAGRDSHRSHRYPPMRRPYSPPTDGPPYKGDLVGGRGSCPEAEGVDGSPTARAKKVRVEEGARHPRGGEADAARPGDAALPWKFGNERFVRCATLQVTGTFTGTSFMMRCNIFYDSSGCGSVVVSLREPA